MTHREIIARALADARNAYFERDVENKIDGRDPDEFIADAILSDIEKRGLCIVPVEPTEAMVEAARVIRYGGRFQDDFRDKLHDGLTRSAYASMISAAPK